jgi:hypothetical protein
LFIVFFFGFFFVFFGRKSLVTLLAWIWLFP